MPADEKKKKIVSLNENVKGELTFPAVIVIRYYIYNRREETRCKLKPIRFVTVFRIAFMIWDLFLCHHLFCVVTFFN